jgi:hypothetical protein
VIVVRSSLQVVLGHPGELLGPPEVVGADHELAARIGNVALRPDQRAGVGLEFGVGRLVAPVRGDDRFRFTGIFSATDFSALPTCSSMLGGLLVRIDDARGQQRPEDLVSAGGENDNPVWPHRAVLFWPHPGAGAPRRSHYPQRLIPPTAQRRGRHPALRPSREQATIETAQPSNVRTARSWSGTDSQEPVAERRVAAADPA